MNKIKQKIILFSVLLIFFLTLSSKGVAMGEKIDYKVQIKEKYKNIDLSDGVNKEEAIILAQNYIIEDEDLLLICVVSKPIVDEKQLSKEYWRLMFPLTNKYKHGFGLLPSYAVVYVVIKTGEVKYAGETLDL